MPGYEDLGRRIRAKNPQKAAAWQGVSDFDLGQAVAEADPVTFKDYTAPNLLESTGRGLWSGALRGTAEGLDALQGGADALGKEIEFSTGIKPSRTGGLSKAADWLRSQAPQGGNLPSEILGGAIPTVARYANTPVALLTAGGAGYKKTEDTGSVAQGVREGAADALFAAVPGATKGLGRVGAATINALAGGGSAAIKQEGGASIGTNALAGALLGGLFHSNPRKVLSDVVAGKVGPEELAPVRQPTDPVTAERIAAMPKESGPGVSAMPEGPIRLSENPAKGNSVKGEYKSPKDLFEQIQSDYRRPAPEGEAAPGPVLPEGLAGTYQIPRGLDAEQANRNKLTDLSDLLTLSSPLDRLRRMGKAQASIARGVDEEADLHDTYMAQFLTHLKPLFEAADEAKREVALTQLGLKAPGEVSDAAKPAKAGVDALFNDVSRIARHLGVKVQGSEGETDFPGYFGQYFPKNRLPMDKIEKPGGTRSRVLANLVDQGNTPAQAEKILADHIKAREHELPDLVDVETPFSGKEFGSLTKAMESDNPVYESDPVLALTRYADGAARQIASHLVWGRGSEKLNGLIRQAPAREQRAVQALVIKARELSTKEPDSLDKILSKARMLMSTKLTPLSAVQNLTQTTNAGLVTDAGSALGGLGKSFTPQGRDLAAQSGATLGTNVRDMLAAGNDDALSKVMGGYLSKIGFKGSENVTRTVSANAGEAYAQKMAARLLKNPGDKFAAAELDKIGLDPNRIQQQGGLSKADVLRAAHGTAKAAQFLSRDMDLPEILTGSTKARTIGQFKNFAAQQAGLVGKEVFGRIGKGSTGRGLRNLALLGTVYPAQQMGYLALRRAVTGQDQKDDLGSAYMEGLKGGSGFGLMSDAVSAASDKNKALAWMAGPTITSLAESGTGVYKLLDSIVHGEADPDQLKGLYRQIPTVGPLTYKRAFPE